MANSLWCLKWLVLQLWYEEAMILVDARLVELDICVCADWDALNWVGGWWDKVKNRGKFSG